MLKIFCSMCEKDERRTVKSPRQAIRDDYLVLRQTESCVLYATAKQTRLATRENATPRSRRVTDGDVTYLLGLDDKTFDAAAVVDYGVGVFVKASRPHTQS